MFNKRKQINLRKNIALLQKKQDILVQKNTSIKTDIQKTVNNTTNIQRADLGYTNCYPANLDIEFSDEPNEPFGWKKGTVRAMITIWVILTTCILAMGIMFLPSIPVLLKSQFYSWWLIIAGIVISSYFISRMSAGMLNRFNIH